MNEDNGHRTFRQNLGHGIGHHGQQQPGQQYGYEHYDMPQAGGGMIERVFGSAVARKFNNPLFATGAFLVAGVAFASIIYMSYPGGEEPADIPVVQADSFAYKEMPTEPGGMSVPNRDSTIFTAMQDGQMEETAPVENLLAEEEPADKLAAFARQVEEAVEEERQSTEGQPAEPTATMAESETPPVTLQKIEKKADEAVQEMAAVEEIVAKPPQEPDKPRIVHKAGENPETLEFVRSVLDKKDGKVASAASPNTQVDSEIANDVATRAASIQPAVGDPTRTFTITPGEHYVQLGSVTSMSGAETEWGKLQSKFSAELGSLPHRVQSANLGERGTFYRIQAGPMSKESAGSICDSIKAQKPGGCLVTK